MGRQCVLLYCGDHDPGGLQISGLIRSNLADLSGAVGWSPERLTIDRFGLNHDFIEEQGLTCDRQSPDGEEEAAERPG